MTDAFKCDRCGEFSDRDPSVALRQDVKTVSYVNDGETVDLCNTCHRALGGWLNNE